MESKPKNLELLGLNLNQLQDVAVENSEPAFRGRQLHKWIYEKGICDLQDITVLPKSWRNLLIQKSLIYYMHLIQSR